MTIATSPSDSNTIFEQALSNDSPQALAHRYRSWSSGWQRSAAVTVELGSFLRVSIIETLVSQFMIGRQLEVSQKISCWFNARAVGEGLGLRQFTYRLHSL